MSWFNTFNSRGQIVGDGTLWLSDDLLIRGLSDNQQTVITDLNGSILHTIQETFQPTGAGGGRWLDLDVNTHILTCYQGPSPEWTLTETDAAISRDGSRILLCRDAWTEHKTLALLTGEVLASGPIMDFSVSAQGAAWTLATGMYTRRTFVCRFDTGEVVDCSLHGWEGAPILIDTAEGLWLLTITQEPSVLLRPIGQFLGYRYVGEHHYPDAIWLNGQIALVSNSSQGVTQQRTQSLADTRTDLRPSAPEPPDPPDPPDPEPEPEPEPVQLPDHVFATLQRLRPNYPTPLVDKGAELINAVAWEHRAEGYGLERKDSGNNCGCPGISVRMGCDILRTSTLGWDVLQDAEGVGNPVQSDSGPADPARFVAPVNPGTTPDPPDPEPEPGDLEERVATLEQQFVELQQQLSAQATAHDVLAEQVEAIDKDVGDLNERVTALESGEPSPDLPSTVQATVIVSGKAYSGSLAAED